MPPSSVAIWGAASFARSPGAGALDASRRLGHDAFIELQTVDAELGPAKAQA